jgi:hypothetical protein
MDVAFGAGRVGAQGGLVEPHHMRQGDQRPDQVGGLTDRGRGAGEDAAAEPCRGAGPAGEVSDQLDTTSDRDTLIDQQVHVQRARGHAADRDPLLGPVSRLAPVVDGLAEECGGVGGVAVSGVE